MSFLAFFLGLAIVAQVAPPPSPAAATMGFSDKSITFVAPEGWAKLDIPPPQSTADAVMVAAFVKNPGKPGQRMIQIVVEDFDEGLTAFETSHESELRKQVDSTFVDKKVKLTLANGMPAYWLKVSQGNQIGQFTRRYEYVLVDLKRGITVSYVGRQGDFDEKEAQAALSNLAVVVYPNRQ